MTNRTHPNDEGEVSEFSGWISGDINRRRHQLSEDDGEGIVSPINHQTELFIRRYDETHSSSEGGNIEYNL